MRVPDTRIYAEPGASDYEGEGAQRAEYSDYVTSHGAPPEAASRYYGVSNGGMRAEQGWPWQYPIQPSYHNPGPIGRRQARNLFNQLLAASAEAPLHPGVRGQFRGYGAVTGDIVTAQLAWSPPAEVAPIRNRISVLQGVGP